MGTPSLPHGKPHQVNLFIKDSDSTRTGRGRHKRCMVFLDPRSGDISVRVDAVEGDESLPWPTERQVHAVATHPVWRMHGRNTRLVLKHSLQEAEPRGAAGIEACRWYLYEVVSRSGH